MFTSAVLNGMAAQRGTTLKSLAERRLGSQAQPQFSRCKGSSFQLLLRITQASETQHLDSCHRSFHAFIAMLPAGAVPRLL